MHLLQVVHRYWPYRGGSEQYFQEMSERLVKKGHRVTVITTDAWDIEYFYYEDRKHLEVLEEVHNGVHIRRFRARHITRDHCRAMRILSRLPFDPVKHIFTLPSAFLPDLYLYILRRTIKDVDIVHASPMPHSSILYAGYLIARKIGTPFVITPFIHTAEGEGSTVRSGYNSRHQISLLRRASLIIIQTEAERKFLLKHGIDKEKTHLLGMGVNKEENTGGDGERFRKKYGIAKDMPVVLHIGTLAYDKGTIHLIEAMKMRWSEGKKGHLVFAGPILSEVKSYLDRQEGDILKNMTFLGFAEGRTKKDMFQACDVMALPSRAESFGIVYLEAWLAGKPVIGAFAGGVPYVIDDGKDGFLVPFGDTHMLAEYIDKLISEKALAREMGKRGFHKVMRTATWGKRYEAFERALQSLL